MLVQHGISVREIEKRTGIGRNRIARLIARDFESKPTVIRPWAWEAGRCTRGTHGRFAKSAA